MLEISDPSYKGKDIAESTAKGYSSVIKMFLATFSKAGIEGLVHLSERGNIIEQRLESPILTDSQPLLLSLTSTFLMRS